MRKKQTRFDWLDRVARLLLPERLKSMLWPLAYHANIAGECHPSVGTLAREAGCGSNDTARRRLHKLAAKGLIEILPRHVPFHATGKTLFVNLYRLKLPLTEPARPCNSLQGHSGETALQKTETTLQNGGDGLAKRADDLAEPCKPNPIGSQLLKPIPEVEEGEPAVLPDHRIDYEKTEPPEINDYADIHDPANDPILVAMGITRERSKLGWGHWVKVLNHARKEHGTERAELLFRGCLAELWGDMKANECRNPGAILNIKLSLVFYGIGGYSKNATIDHRKLKRDREYPENIQVPIL